MAALDQPTRDILDRFQIDVNQAPAVTPALLAYLRGLGMNLSTAEDVRAQRLATISNVANEAVSQQGRDYQQSRKTRTGDLVRRGMLRSGEASTEYGQLAEENQKKLSDIYTGKATGTAGIEQGFAQSRDTLRQGALEQLLGAETQERVQKATSEASTAAIKAQADAQQKYLDQMVALAAKGIKV
jgi:hypothetical protein